MVRYATRQFFFLIAHARFRMLWHHVLPGPGTTPIVILPGSYSNAADVPAMFAKRIRSASGQPVILCDHRESGRSGNDDGTSCHYDLNDMAEDVMRIIQPFPAVSFVGISMGGMIAQRIACMYPRRVHSLTLLMSSPDVSIAPPTARVQRAICREARYYERGLPLRGLLCRWKTHGGTSSAQSKRARWERMRAHGFQSAAQHWQAMSTGSLHDLTQIQCPVLILHGDKDELFPWEHASTLQRGIAGAKLRCIRGQGHDLHDENLDAWVGAMMRNDARDT